MAGTVCAAPLLFVQAASAGWGNDLLANSWCCHRGACRGGGEYGAGYSNCAGCFVLKALTDSINVLCRGGGEYGTGWRDAGSKQHKQNVFDDFQAAAEHLQQEGYCSPATTTIQVSCLV